MSEKIMLELLLFYLQWKVWFEALHQYANLCRFYESNGMLQSKELLHHNMLVNMPHDAGEIVDWSYYVQEI